MISVEAFLKQHECRAQSVDNTYPSCNPAQVYAGLRDAANRGWRIFPTPPAGSFHTLVTSGRIAEATSDLVSLEELADANPGCRWGLATGQASGVFVLEVEGALGRAALNRFASLCIEELSDFQIFTLRAGESVFGFFRYPVGFVLRRGGKHPEPGLTIHGDNDFVLLTPWSAGKLNAEKEVAAAPQWLLSLAFEVVKEKSDRLVPRITPHRADPESLPRFPKFSANAEDQNFNSKGWPAFGQTNWRRKINFPRRA